MRERRQCKVCKKYKLKNSFYRWKDDWTEGGKCRAECKLCHRKSQKKRAGLRANISLNEEEAWVLYHTLMKQTVVNSEKGDYSPELETALKKIVRQLIKINKNKNGTPDDDRRK